MFRKINVLALLVLLLSQTILVPVAPMNLISAEGTNKASESEQTVENEADENEQEESIDKTALLDLLDDIDELDLGEETYTEASFQTFIEAVEVGEEVLEDDAATEEQVDEVVEDIEEAFEALEEVEDEVSEDEETTESEEKESTEEEDEEEVDEEKEEKQEEEEAAEEEKDANKQAKTSKSKAAIQPLHHDGHEGFKLELSEILNDVAPDGQPYDEDNPLKPDDSFWLQLDWTLANDHNYKKDDKETVQLPGEINITEKIIGEELVDEFGNLVATYDVDTNGLVTLTFTDYVEKNSDVKGWIQLRGKLDQDKVQEEDGKVIISPIEEDGKAIEIPIDRTPKDKTVEKQGKPNKSYNADEIEWTVTVNKKAYSLKDVTVEDLLPEGTEYKEGSLKVEKQAASINGELQGEKTEVSVTPSVQDRELSIHLGDIKDVYTITYTTKVKDLDKKKFKNEVVFKDEELPDIEADATVTINRGEPLKKGSVKDYNPKTGIIEWYLEFNYDQKKLEDVTLSDKWTPAGKVELVEDSVKFQEVDIDENGKAHHVGTPVKPSDIGATLKKMADGFEVTGITTDKPYYIVYDTKVKDRVVDNEGFRFENKAKFDGNESGEGYNIGQFVGAKSAGKVDYKKKTIEWTIRVNSDERSMKDVIIEDTLGPGLTLIEDSIDMTIGGDTYTDYELENDDPFILKDIGDTDQEIIVTYKTSFKADDIPKRLAENKATISWIPEDDSKRLELDVEADKQLNRHTEDNSWKAGKYDPDTKEITWNIVANYRENEIDNLIVHDEPQENQQLIPGSVTVTELEIKEDGTFVEGQTIDPKIKTDNNQVHIEIGKTDKAYFISYKTSIAGLTDVEQQYTNKATINDGTELIKEIEGKVGIYADRKYGNKRGVQDGKQVHWSIDVNLAQEKIKNLQLVDKISENQEYLEDTIKVYEAKLTLQGDGTKPEVDDLKAEKGDLVSPDDYELEINETEFTINWKDTVERAYIVEYSTLFFVDKDGEKVRNDYKISGEGIPDNEESSNDGYNAEIRLLSTGGAQGGTGYLLVEKLDTTYGQKTAPIENIEFELIDTATDKVLKTITTDADGRADFGRLLFGEYALKEVNVPDGYVTPEEMQTIKIDEKYDPNKDEALNYVYEVENYQPNHDVELLKKDENSKVLADAEFTLYKENGDEVETATTDADGKIAFKDLASGKYYFQETKAPKGYVLNDEKHEFEITEKQKEPIEIEAVNNHETIEIPVEKVWQADGEKPSVTVELLPTEETLELNEENDWQASFTNLRKFDDAGEEITYEVRELYVDGYIAEVAGSQEDGFVITNTEKTAISGEKIWLDDDAADRPSSITVALLANDEQVAEQKVTSVNNWQYTFDNLPKLDKDGEEIKYTVQEKNVPKGYESTVDGFDITNLRVAKTDITGEKIWQDPDTDKRPNDITVNLLANGEKVKTKKIKKKDDWTYIFSDLAVYDEKGKEIAYTVEEENVAGYESEVDGFDITNTRTGKTKVVLTKTWKDDAGETALRTDKVTVNLFQNGQYYDTFEITKADGWELTVDELEAFDAQGQPYDYTMTEHDVPGYAASFDATDVTNTRSEKKDIQVTKTWFDDGATDRPTEITFDLVRTPTKDGQAVGDKEVVDTFTISKHNGWKFTVKGIDAFDSNGLPYLYEVEEHAVDGYQTEVHGFDIVNTRTGEVNIAGTKTWNDTEDTADRPASITVNLLANGEKVADMEVMGELGWDYTFVNLPKYDDRGKEIVYSLEEEPVVGYESLVDGYDITNTRTGETEVAIEKVWQDDEGETALRPDTIKMNLFQNDRFLKTYTVKAEEDWKLTVEDLPKYDEHGAMYKYTVTEQDVPGYAVDYDGLTVTNTRSDLKDITITKSWLDEDHSDRPDEIKVDLYRSIYGVNKEKVDTYTVKAADDWVLTVEELDAFNDQGLPYSFTLEEQEVDGYESFAAGFDLVNVRVGETEVTGTKTWLDDDAKERPEAVTVELYRNGVKFAETEANAETDWTYAFTDLPEFDNRGVAYDYTVEELVPAGYEASFDGYDITNTRVGKTEVAVEKVWQGATEDSVTLRLLANGEEVDSLVLTAAMDWTYVFTDLAAFDEVGEAIEYTVEEEAIDGYESVVTGDAEEGFTVTNTRTGTTDVTVTKSWQDESADERPEVITVNLFADGELVEEYDVTAADDWALTIEDLPKYDEQGEEIVYTIEEHDVAGYESAIDGFDITNTITGEKSIDITKSWLDDEAEDRPSSIEVELFRSVADSDKELVETYEVTAADDWTLTVDKLAAFDDNGKAYTYEIEEVPVDGYESAVNGFHITNTRTGITAIDIEKVWKNDEATNRPDSITVDILQNEEVFETVEMTERSDWKYSTELPKYDEQGVAFVYTVSEHDVANYESDIKEADNVFTITNTYVEEEEPEKPEEPSKPEEPGKPSEPGKPGESGSLPSTATNIFNIGLIGAIFLLAGITIYLARRREA